MKDEELIKNSNPVEEGDPFARIDFESVSNSSGDSEVLLSQDEVDLLLGGVSSLRPDKEICDFKRQNLLSSDQYDRILKLHASVSGMIARVLEQNYNDLDIKILSSDIFHWDEFYHSIPEDSHFIEIGCRSFPWLLMQMGGVDFSLLQSFVHGNESTDENSLDGRSGSSSINGEKESLESSSEFEHQTKKFFTEQIVYQFFKIWHGLHLNLDSTVRWNHFLLDASAPYDYERVYQVLFSLSYGNQDMVFSVLYPLFELSDVLRVNTRILRNQDLIIEDGREPFVVEDKGEESLAVQKVVVLEGDVLENLKHGSWIKLQSDPSDDWCLFSAVSESCLAKGGLEFKDGKWAFRVRHSFSAVKVGAFDGEDLVASGQIAYLLAGNVSTVADSALGFEIDQLLLLDRDSKHGELAFVFPDGHLAQCRVRFKEGAFYIELLNPIQERLDLKS